MGRHKVERVKLICRNCGEVFERLASDVRWRHSWGSKNPYCSLACVKERKRKKLLQRAQAIKRLREDGQTLQEIGKLMGVSYQRVSQILKEAENG